MAELARLKEEHAGQVMAMADDASAKLAAAEANRQAAVDGFLEETRILHHQHASAVVQAVEDAGVCFGWGGGVGVCGRGGGRGSGGGGGGVVKEGVRRGGRPPGWD